MSKLTKRVAIPFRKTLRFIKDNYFISIFAAIVLFVGFVAVFKILNSQTETVYAKVKVSQGLWWASTAKPTIWMAHAVKKGDVERSLTGKPVVEVLSVRTYPWWDSEQYDIYLILKLDVSFNENTEKYTFKRSQLSVGSPVDLNLSSIQISGTVMDLSEKPLEKKMVDKIVTLKKKFAEQWESEAIQVGDTAENGEEVIFEVLEKKVIPAHEMYSSLGNNYPIEVESPVNITVKAKMKVHGEDGTLIYREEHPLQLGRTLNLRTPTFAFNHYTVSAIE